MSILNTTNPLQSFWKCLKQSKFKAALRLFHSDTKNSIFHDIKTLCNLSSFLKNDSNSMHQQYFTLFILHNGVNSLMADARHSRRWKADKYHSNVMIMYDLLGHLIQSKAATVTHCVRNNHTNIFKVLVHTLAVDNILGYPYFDRHLQLFWDYLMVLHSSSFAHQTNIYHLAGFALDDAIEAIYLAMHNSKYTPFESVHKYKGLALQILCTIYYYNSTDVTTHWRLENKQHIMMHILQDYFLLTCTNCDDHCLYSTEKSIAKFISHSYNFAYFMDKIVELIQQSHSRQSRDRDDQDIITKRSVINAQNMYRILIPFEIILTASHSRQKMDYYINTLVNTIQRIWQIQAETQVVHNRFLYLGNDGNVDSKLGRYSCDDMNSYSWFDLLQRTNRTGVVNLLRTVLVALQGQMDKDVTTITSTQHLQHAMTRLCSVAQGINTQEMTDLRHEIMNLNASLIGRKPVSTLDDIINYYQRTFLLSSSNRYPLDIHNLILCYCHAFACDPVMNAIKAGQIVLFNVSLSNLIELTVDTEYTFGEWRICRVEDVVYGPMGNTIQILIVYKVGLSNYGYLWLQIQYVKWIEERKRWQCNVMVNKKNDKDTEDGMLKLWLPSAATKWIEQEKQYKSQMKEIEMKMKGLKGTNRAPVRTPYLTLNTKRKYKSQRK
eukprot:1144586_1